MIGWWGIIHVTTFLFGRLKYMGVSSLTARHLKWTWLFMLSHGISNGASRPVISIIYPNMLRWLSELLSVSAVYIYVIIQTPYEQQSLLQTTSHSFKDMSIAYKPQQSIQVRRSRYTSPKWHGHAATDIDRPPLYEYRMLNNPPFSSLILYFTTRPILRLLVRLSSLFPCHIPHGIPALSLCPTRHPEDLPRGLFE